MIWEAMQRGMASAAWVVGLIAVLGLFAAVILITVLALTYAFRDDDEEEEDAGDD